MKKFETLKRPTHKMSEFMLEALEENDLMEAYRARPPYQQNDYVWWISSQKRDATKHK